MTKTTQWIIAATAALFITACTAPPKTESMWFCEQCLCQKESRRDCS
ncbi:MAG: hypothetical protein NTW94_07345 [Legionellales bacterium]|nr:hypothetical protein [Legionellales bacterium]